MRDLTQNEVAVLGHTVVSPAEWWAHVSSTFDETKSEAMLAAKVSRWQAEYDAASATPGYKTAAERAEDDLPPEPTLDQLKALASRRIDINAERARQVWATGGELQSLVYSEKRREAETFDADPAPNAASYPLLSAEIGLTGATLADVAAVVLEKSAAWTQAAAAIERIRVGAKKGIAAATDQAGIDAVVAGMKPWPIPN